jgi:hypothetical protein
MPPWLAEPLAALRTMVGGLAPLLAELWPVLAAALLALLFLALWLHARARPGDPELREQLRAARNEIKLLKGDLIHARRTHTAELQKISKELDTLRGGRGRG